MKIKYDRHVNLMLDIEQFDFLRMLSNEWKISISSIIRLLIAEKQKSMKIEITSDIKITE